LWSTCCPRPPARPLQGLELLDGQLRSGLPFDLGSSGANEGFASMTQATHDRLGSGQLMPAELFAAGGCGGGWLSSSGSRRVPGMLIAVPFPLPAHCLLFAWWCVQEATQ
jgi:hypothetical protein